MILALDTSTLLAGVALVDLDGRLLASRAARVTTHSEHLLVLVDQVMAERSARATDLAAIACGAGPGSFTGLRIGLATAKGLCVALDRPLILISSLQAIARRAPAGVYAVPCIDAFKGEIYAGFYRAGVIPEALSDEAVLAPAALVSRLCAAAAQAETMHLLGDVVHNYPALAIPGVNASDTALPGAADIGFLAAQRHRRGERDDLASAIPTYIRPSEAEILAAQRANTARDPPGS